MGYSHAQYTIDEIVSKMSDILGSAGGGIPPDNPITFTATKRSTGIVDISVSVKPTVINGVTLVSPKTINVVGKRGSVPTSDVDGQIKTITVTGVTANTISFTGLATGTWHFKLYIIGDNNAVNYDYRNVRSVVV